MWFKTNNIAYTYTCATAQCIYAPLPILRHICLYYETTPDPESLIQTGQVRHDYLSLGCSWVAGSEGNSHMQCCMEMVKAIVEELWMQKADSRRDAISPSICPQTLL